MTMNNFELHPQLDNDTGFIVDLPLCRLLRMRDKNYPWAILVPRVSHAREWFDLGDPQQRFLNQEITATGRWLQATYKPDKLNIGALGNIVPQLHIHVIARFTSDAAWPKPIWGAVPPLPFTEPEWLTELATWRASFDPHRIGS